MKNKFFDWVGLFESNLTAAEWAWRLITFGVIVAGGTTTGLLAKTSELLGNAGPIVWASIGLAGSLVMAVIFSLIKLANLHDAQAEYTRAMAAMQGRTVNPLLESYKDQVIPIEDLRLPGKQGHENKHFKRCKFVGPGAIVIMGGNYLNSGFIECGDVIVLPENVLLSGIVVLQNCTVEECEFYRVTVLTNTQAGLGFKAMGANVVGLPYT